MTKQVLVLGATGKIAGHAIEALLKILMTTYFYLPVTHKI